MSLHVPAARESLRRGIELGWIKGHAFLFDVDKISYLPTGRTLVGAPVYVSVVLQTAGMLEQLAALVAGIPTRPPTVQSLLHTVGEVLRRGCLREPDEKK